MADKPTVQSFTSNSTFQANKANNLANQLATAIEGCLGRGGVSESPNSMTDDLDMDLNKIQNLATPSVDKDAANKDYVDSAVAAAANSPTLTGANILTLSGAVKYVDTITDLKAIDVSSLDNKTEIDIKGHTSVSDGGEGRFYWDNANTDTDNNGTIIQANSVATGRWLRMYKGNVTPEWFGAKADGSTDDSTAIQAAINVLPASGGTVIFKGAKYGIGSSLTLKSRVMLEGIGTDGSGSDVRSRIIALANLSSMVSTASGSTYTGIHIRNLTLDGNKASYTVTWAIDFYNLTASTIDNIYTYDVSGGGLYLRKPESGQYAWLVNVINSTFGGHATADYCIRIGVSDSHFANNYIANGKGALVENGNNKFTNCHFELSTIDGCKSDDIGGGGIVFAGCCFIDNTDSGLSLSYASQTDAQASISGCFFNNNDSGSSSNPDIYLGNCHKVAITGCATAGTAASLTLAGDTDYITAVGNRFTGTMTTVGTHNYILDHNFNLRLPDSFKFKGNPIVQGTAGFDTADETATLYVGDSGNYLQAVQGKDTILRSYYGTNIQVNNSATTGLFIDTNAIVDFKGTFGDSTKNPSAVAEDDWLEIKLNGTTYYIPLYAAS